MENGTAAVENSTAVPQNLKTGLPNDPAILLLLYIQKNWKQISRKYLYTHVHSIAHNCQNVEATQMW